jgi:S-adenosylmethionine/arginine decarboxylase-like enzyme
VVAVIVHVGKGSTLISFDLYLDKESNLKLAFTPQPLHKQIGKWINAVGMKKRRSLLDTWGTIKSGPISSFTSVAESHVRIETWPDELHINGDIQLCNFTKDNSRAAHKLLCFILEEINPWTAYALTCVRGPGPILTPVRRATFFRGKGPVVEEFKVIRIGT